MELTKKNYPIKEVAELTGLNQRQIMYKIRRKQIEAEKVGWIWIISKDEVTKLLTEEAKS